jgi:hypothetical protein
VVVGAVVVVDDVVVVGAVVVAGAAVVGEVVWETAAPDAASSRPVVNIAMVLNVILNLLRGAIEKRRSSSCARLGRSGDCRVFRRASASCFASKQTVETMSAVFEQRCANRNVHGPACASKFEIVNGGGSLQRGWVRRQ